MSFTKHVAQHNQRKCIVIFREIPNEDHMALITYTDDLPAQIHDALIKAVDSPQGQETTDLADVLHRTTTSDNRLLLDLLHNEHRLKKVPANQVLLTPNSRTKQRLDEVNKLLADIKLGNDAAKRAKELDESLGMATPYSKGRDVGEPPLPMQSLTPMPVAPMDGVLSDADIAKGLLEQAKVHELNAKTMIAEANRLKKEAKGLKANVKATTTTTNPTTKRSKTQTA